MIYLGYLIRRIRDGGLPCRARLCAGRTVGLSVWCRQHTDQILSRPSASPNEEPP